MSRDDDGPVWSFDVAVIPAHLPASGRRDISRPRWSRVLVSVECVWRHPVTRAHLLACQFAGTRGMVVEVLYRE
jgi:hypothetical protein